MSDSLIDEYGRRKYVVSKERAAFTVAARQQDTEFMAFCLMLAITGARISEALALGIAGIDIADRCVVIRTLKQRDRVKFRMVPAPTALLTLLGSLQAHKDGRLWSFGRTHAWSRVKEVMRTAGIGEAQCKPKALRHGFAVAAVLKGVPLNILQRWMGHARLETTAIYASVLGEEERKLATRTWHSLELSINKWDLR